MPHHFSRRVRAGMAIAATVVVGLAAVYVSHRGAVHTGGRCQEAAQQARALKPLATGALAALLVAETPHDLSALIVHNPDGSERRLGDSGGRTRLLNLWATWCAPCRAEMPHLEALQTKRGGDDFSVIALNVDVGDPDKPGRFLRDLGATTIIDLRDPEMRAFGKLKSEGLVFGLPTTFVVDRNGCALASLAGPANWDGEEALALVDAAVGPH